MAYIKFKDSEDFLTAVVLPTGNNTVKITTNTEPNLSGFRLYLRDNEDYPLDNGEYEAYTTLYRQGAGWYELSNDGSVYQEVAPVQPEEPTEEELAEMARQQEIADICSQISNLKAKISDTDYKVIKAYEYSLVGILTEYDMEALHQERQILRDKINELETQLSELIKTE